MSIHSTGPGDLGPLVVKPKVAWKMLACSNTRGYELLAVGELESFLDGRSRKITVESIHRYIARRLAPTDIAPSPQPTQPPRRGQPRKNGVAGGGAP
jgi:hypothetical protein